MFWQPGVGDWLWFALIVVIWALYESWTFRTVVLLMFFWRWDTLWFWFRWATWDSRIGWWVNARSYRRYFSLSSSMGPVKRDVFMRDIDMEDNETVIKCWVKLVEMSEIDLRNRMKFLTAPASDEDSRRGRSRRGRGDFHPERMRQFNMERSIPAKDGWNIPYPSTIWDGSLEERRPHPRAGQIRPVNREEIEDLPAHISEQISDHIDALNEPPEELPEVRDSETGEVLEEEVVSPLGQS